MSGCNGCAGCGGCGSLELNERELFLLNKLGQIPFLPVARKREDMEPIYLEEGTERAAEYSLILQCLEKKNLISIDYDQPLKNWDYSVYGSQTVHGSIAITHRGQQVLELLEIQGITETA